MPKQLQALEDKLNDYRNTNPDGYYNLVSAQTIQPTIDDDTEKYLFRALVESQKANPASASQIIQDVKSNTPIPPKDINLFYWAFDKLSKGTVKTLEFARDAGTAYPWLAYFFAGIDAPAAAAVGAGGGALLAAFGRGFGTSTAGSPKSNPTSPAIEKQLAADFKTLLYITVINETRNNNSKFIKLHHELDKRVSLSFPPSLEPKDIAPRLQKTFYPTMDLLNNYDDPALLGKMIIAEIKKMSAQVTLREQQQNELAIKQQTINERNIIAGSSIVLGTELLKMFGKHDWADKFNAAANGLNYVRQACDVTFGIYTWGSYLNMGAAAVVGINALKTIYDAVKGTPSGQQVTIEYLKSFQNMLKAHHEYVEEGFNIITKNQQILFQQLDVIIGKIDSLTRITTEILDELLDLRNAVRKAYEANMRNARQTALSELQALFDKTTLRVKNSIDATAYFTNVVDIVKHANDTSREIKFVGNDKAVKREISDEIKSRNSISESLHLAVLLARELNTPDISLQSFGRKNNVANLREWFRGTFYLLSSRMFDDAARTLPDSGAEMRFEKCWDTACELMQVIAYISNVDVIYDVGNKFQTAASKLSAKISPIYKDNSISIDFAKFQNAVKSTCGNEIVAFEMAATGFRFFSQVNQLCQLSTWVEEANTIYWQDGCYSIEAFLSCYNDASRQDPMQYVNESISLQIQNVKKIDDAKQTLQPLEWIMTVLQLYTQQYVPKLSLAYPAITLPTGQITSPNVKQHKLDKMREKCDLLVKNTIARGKGKDLPVSVINNLIDAILRGGSSFTFEELVKLPMLPAVVAQANASLPDYPNQQADQFIKEIGVYEVLPMLVLEMLKLNEEFINIDLGELPELLEGGKYYLRSGQISSMQGNKEIKKMGYYRVTPYYGLSLNERDGFFNVLKYEIAIRKNSVIKTSSGLLYQTVTLPESNHIDNSDRNAKFDIVKLSQKIENLEQVVLDQQNLINVLMQQNRQLSNQVTMRLPKLGAPLATSQKQPPQPPPKPQQQSAPQSPPTQAVPPPQATPTLSADPRVDKADDQYIQGKAAYKLGDNQQALFYFMSAKGNYKTVAHDSSASLPDKQHAQKRLANLSKGVNGQADGKYSTPSILKNTKT